MLICLIPDSLFNLADKALNFSGGFLSFTFIFQVGIPGQFSGLLLDRAFDFMDLARRLIVRAWFHGEVLLRSVAGTNQYF
jgi:hypothetical protein